ncbi:MAG: TonB-dependent receptor [Acidovorax sp.]
MKTLNLRLAALSLAALAACSAHAQSTAALPDMVVTATRTPQPLTDVVADVSVVDRDTIERSGATGLADVLARLPGVEMVRNGGPGATTSVFVRGAESRFTAVYIDGVRVDSQSTGGASWQNIPLSMIDRIEVLRGPASAIYGSDAISGVVQIFTKKGEKGVAPYVGVGAGTYGTYKAEAGVSGATDTGAGAVDYAVGIAREVSQGFNARPIAGQNPDRDGYRSTALSGRLGLQINPANRIEATLTANDMNAGYDDFGYSPAKPVDDRALGRLRALGLNWQSQWTEQYKTRLSVTDSTDRYETTPSPYLTRTHLRGYLFQNEYRLGAHLFTAALERREDQLTNDPIDRSRAQDSLALGWGYHAGPHTLQINARHDSDSEFGGKSTGSAAYGYHFTPQWRVTGSVGTAFRAPTLYQRFSAYGQAGLQPEEGRNAEVGLHWAEQASSFSVVAYRNRVKNLITYGAPGPCPSPFGCYYNTARAQYEGVTVSAAHRVGTVNLRGSLDFQDPKNLDNGKQLARRARRHATFGADTTVAGWTLGGEVQVSARRYDDAANTKVLGGYTLASLYASTRLARDYTLVARVDNLGDKNYQLANGYATAGRTFYVGLKWAPSN